MTSYFKRFLDRSDSLELDNLALSESFRLDRDLVGTLDVLVLGCALVMLLEFGLAAGGVGTGVGAKV